MSKEGADAIRSFGRKNVFELARLLGDFLFIFHLKSLCEQPFGQPVTANDVLGTAAAFLREVNHLLAMFFFIDRWPKRHVAAIQN